MRPRAPGGLRAFGRQIPLGRAFAVGEEVLDRRARGAGEVDAGRTQLDDRAPEFLRLGNIAHPPPGPAAGGELRHLEKLQRLAELVGIDAGALLELANVALRERVEARRERDAPERGACAFAGYEEVRARRKR